MQLTLHMPGWIERVAAGDGAELRAIAALVHASARSEVHVEGAMAALAPIYGISRQHDWPIAPLRLRAAGVDPGERYWLQAVPVLLEAGRDDVRVARAVTDLDAAQSAELLSTLSRHFATDALTFVAAAAGDWYVGSVTPVDLRTASLATVLGLPLRDRLPRGADAPVWRRWQQEIEMLLHDHPVNGRREAAGLTIVNGVWLQNGGRLPGGPEKTTNRDEMLKTPHLGGARSIATFSDDADLRALAAFAGRTAAPPPQDAHAVIAADNASHVVITVPANAPSADVDLRFAEPARVALDRGELVSVDIVMDGAGSPALQWCGTRAPWLARAFRRAPPPLAESIERALTMHRGGDTG